MKELNFEQLENIQGGDNRGCTILGGVATIFGIAGYFCMPLWSVTGAAVIAGVVYGCF